jgi:NAD(P)-dependent dehydrogenase (short-subunit alcohol dehydrogenase family)
LLRQLGERGFGLLERFISHRFLPLRSTGSGRNLTQENHSASRRAAGRTPLNGLTLALRYELWDENIQVISATPGTTATAIWKAGGVEPPPGAQTPEQSARTILAGVANNERLVLGDEGDVSGAKLLPSRGRERERRVPVERGPQAPKRRVGRVILLAQYGFQTVEDGSSQRRSGARLDGL